MVIVRALKLDLYMKVYLINSGESKDGLNQDNPTSYFILPYGCSLSKEDRVWFQP